MVEGGQEGEEEKRERGREEGGERGREEGGGRGRMGGDRTRVDRKANEPSTGSEELVWGVLRQELVQLQ